MRKYFASAMAGLSAIAAFAGDLLEVPVMGDPIGPAQGNQFVFSLMPKAFHRNPNLNMTVICQLTEYGRSLPAATPESPLYYITHDAGHRQMGEPVGNEKLPDSVYLKQILQRSLSTNGYLPAGEKTPPPTLVLIYHWGAHYRWMDGSDMPSMIPLQVKLQQMRERAKLIGGQRFVRDFNNRMDFGFPVLDRNMNMELLSSQAANDLFFVVVSAYDHTALQLQGEQRLVWRANLTVNAQAVAMNETLPALVLTASPVFGRDMKAPQVVVRPLRRGTVKLAPLIVLATEEPAVGKRTP